MKTKLLGLIVLFVLILTACAANNQEVEEPQMLNVDLMINPEKAEADAPVIFEAKVTYGDEEVTDANDVKFEIWRSQDEQHETIVVEHAENGIYRLEKSFSEEGTYYIYAHVTARSMHNMPKKEFVIGEPSEPETASPSSSMEMDEQGVDSGEHGEDHE